VQGLRQIVWASQNPSKPCSKMLRSPEVIKTNDIAQTFDQPYRCSRCARCRAFNFVRFLLASVAPSLLYTAVRLVRLINWITATGRRQTKGEPFGGANPTALQGAVIT
jgi:hypothetical protein